MGIHFILHSMLGGYNFFLIHVGSGFHKILLNEFYFSLFNFKNNLYTKIESQFFVKEIEQIFTKLVFINLKTMEYHYTVFINYIFLVYERVSTCYLISTYY